MADSLDGQVRDTAASVLICDAAQMDRFRIQAAALAGQAAGLRFVADLEHEDLDDE